jgi:ubiquinone/menaquinone biosynthesis C-methylase UbiE
MISSMGVPFDHIASTSDSTYASGRIGQMQRRRVWRYLEKITPELKGLEILELNCGTGDDAVLFSDRGFNIVATDVSEEMLKVTQQKVQQYSLQHKISSHYLDLDAFDETVFHKKFDLVFSNFGGLNSINPAALVKLLDKIPVMLTPRGRFVAVVGSRYCLWETLFYLLKFNFKMAFRRWTKREVITECIETNFKNWYYQPSQIIRWTTSAFSLNFKMPVGISIPPIQLEPFFERRERSLFRFYSVEKKLSRFSFLSGYADHYLIDLELK